jgi:hypothetical protein
MRLDISHILNVDKLDWAINRIGKENIAYIIMSEKTSHDLAIGRDGACNYLGGSGYYLRYHDVPIAVCERVPYGEVEFVERMIEDKEI